MGTKGAMRVRVNGSVTGSQCAVNRFIC